jgi:Holliday junction resolvase RusA-like endonuclease
MSARTELQPAPWPGPPATADILADLELDITPKPKGRPRAGHGRVYTPAETRAYEDRVGWLLRAAHVPCADGELGVRAVFHLGSGAEPDVDNLAKALLDAGNGVLWRDDKQVKQLLAEIAPGGPPRIRLTVYRLTPPEGRNR